MSASKQVKPLNLIAIGRERMRQSGESLAQAADQLDASFERAAHTLADCRGHVITSGVGATGMIAKRFAHLLSCVGCPALFLHSGDALHGSSAAVRADDVLFLISRGGETDESCKLAEIAAGRKPVMIALTARPQSRLGRLSTIVLKLETPDAIDPYGGKMAVGSSLVMGAYCDALVWAVLELKGTSREEFIRHHPGGTVAHL
jgi:D-arabinose 5-phosphate isomerase GutQ